MTGQPTRTAHLNAAAAHPESQSHFHHAQFTIACAYARLGRKAEAVDWLRRTGENGMPNYPLFRNDPNLRSLQGDRAYRVRAVVPHVGALVRGMRQGGAHTLSVVIVPVVLAGLWLTMIWWRPPDGDTAVPKVPDVVAS